MNDIVEILGEAWVWSALDVLGEYLKVPVKDENKEKTTPLFYLGTSRNTRLTLAHRMRQPRTNVQKISSYLGFEEWHVLII